MAVGLDWPDADGATYVFPPGLAGEANEEDAVAFRSNLNVTVGWGIASLDDATGNGLGDLALGMPEPGSGLAQVAVLEGSSSAWVPGQDYVAEEVAHTLVTDIPGGAQIELGSLGDWNGDGRAELGVATQGDWQSNMRGEVVTGDLPAGSATLTDVSVFSVRSVTYGSWPSSIDGGGDVDADGYDDLVYAVHPVSTAWVFLGSATGRSGVSNGKDADVTLVGPENSELGYDVRSLGDVDGNGHDDVLLGASESSVSYLFDGVHLAGTIDIPQQDATAWFVGEQGTHVGDRNAAVGDLDSDGHDDVLIAGPGAGTAIFFGGIVTE